MKCPKCGQDYACPCKNCKDTFSKGKVVWIRHGDDTESCPKCGLRKHLDQWLDVELEQLNLKKKCDCDGQQVCDICQQVGNKPQKDK